MNCPCCGQMMVGRDVRVWLESNTVSVGSRAVRLSPRQAEILSVLAEGRPLPVKKDHLMRRVYGVVESEGAYGALLASISQMRKKIAPLGLRIINQKPHNEGGQAVEGAYSLVIM